MSWLLQLYETYESNLDRVGVIQRKGKDKEYTLLPISHTTQNAHIEVAVTEEGEFHSAFVVDKDDANTLIPCTEDSASRAGSVIAPYPLHDKLSYVAGDYTAYGGLEKKKDHYAHYIQALERWASSPYANAKVKSIYKYLSKGRLIQDLVNDKVLFLDSSERLIDKWDKKYEAQHGENKPDIFAAVAGDQESAFIRFDVYSADKNKVWKDPQMYDSFIQYYSHQLGDEDYCYVTGRMQPSTEKHANKIRHAADKAKLISANDSSGFTYRGRFTDSGQVSSIGYDVSQKAHNALKWLINHQGKMLDQRAFLIWGNDGEDVPDLMEDTFAIDPVSVVDQEITSYTHKEKASQFSKAIDGYRNTLKDELTDDVKSSSRSNVSILILDSATTGRMAVLYYRSMDKDQYLHQLVHWHSTCVWLHRYRKDQDGQFVQFYGAPATKDIAFAAYGPRVSDKVVKGLMERMFPCILDNRKVPLDIVNSVFYRASSPISMERWEWEKTLSIACALINYTREEEGYKVALDTNNTDRDYLFGRMLAIADVLERRALGNEETRATNAIRYMNSFARHPERTWRTIQAGLQPYQERLGSKGTYLSNIIDEVASSIPFDQFNNKPLSGKYLLGFYSQRHELYQKKDKMEDAVEASNE